MAPESFLEIIYANKFDIPVIGETGFYKNTTFIDNPIFPLERTDYSSPNITNYIIDKIKNKFSDKTQLLIRTSLNLDYKSIFELIPENITSLVIEDISNIDNILPYCWIGGFKNIMITNHYNVCTSSNAHISKLIIEMINSCAYLETFELGIGVLYYYDEIKNTCNNQNITFLKSTN